MEHKTAIIAGASGQVGSFLLPMLLENDTYSKVISVGRKLIPLEHPKLEQRVLNLQETGTLSIAGQDVFCCLGTTIKRAGSRENFSAVDKDLVLKLAMETRTAGATVFAVVSAMGSDPGSSIFYSRVKGEMELELQKIGFPSVVIVKPSMLLGQREELRLGELTGKILMQIFAPLIPKKYKAVHAAKVARAMLNAVMKSKSGVTYVLNAEISET